MSTDIEQATTRVDIALRFLDSTALEKYSGQRIENGVGDIVSSAKAGVEKMRNQEHAASVIDSIIGNDAG